LELGPLPGNGSLNRLPWARATPAHALETGTPECGDNHNRDGWPRYVCQVGPNLNRQPHLVHEKRWSMKWPKFLNAATVLATALFMVSGVHSQVAYEVVTVSDGGSISGVVKWTGVKPKPLTLPITKDVNVCDPDRAGTRDLERLEISPDGGVANTVVFLRGVTKGKDWDLPTARRSLDQLHCRYIPHISLVRAGGDFALKSSDPILHTIHMMGATDYNLPFPMTGAH
jgi:hypothetical protein